MLSAKSSQPTVAWVLRPSRFHNHGKKKALDKKIKKSAKIIARTLFSFNFNFTAPFAEGFNFSEPDNTVIIRKKIFGEGFLVIYDKSRTFNWSLILFIYYCTYLVVVVDHLAGIDDGEVGREPCHLRLAFRPDKHVLREVVLPRQLRDDAHVLARLRARPAVPIEHIPVFFFDRFFNLVFNVFLFWGGVYL